MMSLDEKRSGYVRVTDIISRQSTELRNVPLEILANACLRGDKVHAYCTAWARDLWVSDVEEEYKPYFDAFVQWASANVEEVLHTSNRLYDDTLRFTGEFDMIVRLKGSNQVVLLDIKTSSTRSKTWGVQLAAYAHLCKLNGYHFDKVINLHLRKTHSPLYEIKEGEKVMISPPQIKLIEIEHEDVTQYWEIFSSALKCYYYFEHKERA